MKYSETIKTKEKFKDRSICPKCGFSANVAVCHSKLKGFRKPRLLTKYKYRCYMCNKKWRTGWNEESK